MDKKENNRHKVGAITAALCTVVAIVVVFTGAMPMGGGGGGRGPGGEGMEQEDTNIAIDVMNPARGNIYVTGEYVGTVEPNQQVTVYPKVSGEVLSVNYNVGDIVEQGAVLFRIDSSTLQNSIAQTQASIASSEALAQLNLDQAEVDYDNYQNRLDEGYNATLMAAEAAVESARNSVSSAQSNLLAARKSLREARSNDESDQSIESAKSTVTQREYDLESAQLRLEQAEADLEAAKLTVEEQEYTLNSGIAKAELNADMTQQYLQLQQQQSDLDNYNVTAPISGVIEQRNVDAYSMASTGAAAFVISNKDAMTVSFSVSETTLGYLQVGDSVTVEKGGNSCEGYITEISTMVDSSTGLFTIKANVEAPGFALLSGSMVKVHVNTKKAENDIMITIDSVYYENNKPYVYLYQSGKAMQAFIETGISDETYIQVLGGLSESDQVISTWSANLMDGVDVILVGELQAVPLQTDNTEEGEADRYPLENAEDVTGQDEPDDILNEESLSGETGEDGPASETEGAAA